MQRLRDSSGWNVRGWRAREGCSRLERRNGRFHSGQVKAGAGYTQWVFKFDGSRGAETTA